jgi:hypothetical protein
VTGPATPSLYKLERNLTLAQVVAELAAMPDRLRQEVAGVSREALLRPPAAGEWSAFQVLCHFRDAALVYAIRFRHIVFDRDPFLPDYDENNWVAACPDTPEDVPAVLNQVAASRADIIRVLSRLPAEAWRRGGLHEVIGPVVLEDYARHQVVHEEMHLAQLRAAARQAG